MLWLWLLHDIAVIGVAALLSVLALSHSLGMGLLVVTVLYAFLTIQVEGSSITSTSCAAPQTFCHEPTVLLRMEAGPMNRNRKRAASTPINAAARIASHITPHGIPDGDRESVFYLIRPDKSSVLSRGHPPHPLPHRPFGHPAFSLELLALDSASPFQPE